MKNEELKNFLTGLILYCIGLIPIIWAYNYKGSEEMIIYALLPFIPIMFGSIIIMPFYILIAIVNKLNKLKR